MKTKTSSITAHIKVLLFALLILLTFAIPALANRSQQEAPTSVEALGSISGSVTNEAGEPLAGIAVTIDNRKHYFGQWEHQVRTDDDGHYHFPHLQTDVYRLAAHDPSNNHGNIYFGGTTLREEAAEIPIAGSNVTNVEITMLYNVGLAGTISTSEALFNGSYSVEVYGLDEDDPDPLNWSFVDRIFLEFEKSSDWGYLFDSLEPGRYRVCASSDGHLAAEDGEYHRYYECFNDIVTNFEDAEDVIVGPNAVTHNVNFHLGESNQYATISGTVTNPQGQPVEGVNVSAYPPPSRSLPKVATDANGHYTLRVVPPFSSTILFDPVGSIFAQKYYDSYDESDAQKLSLSTAEDVQNIDVQFEEGGSISGEITLEGKSFGYDISILLSRQRMNRSAPDAKPLFYPYKEVKGIYDPSNGRYLVEGLPPGNFLVRTYYYLNNSYLSSYHGGQSNEDAIPVAVELGEAVGNIDLELAPARFEGTIEGYVSSGNEPVAGIQAQLIYASALAPVDTVPPDAIHHGAIISYVSTDEEGQFSIGGLNSGEYAIRFLDTEGNFVSTFYEDASGGRIVSIEEGTTAKGINGNLERAASVSGTITHTNGQPASAYEIFVEQQNDDSTVLVRRWVYTDERGYYEIGGLEPGYYTLKFREQDSEDVYLTLDVHVETGVSVSGQNGTMGPSTPTSLPAVDEPANNQPQMTEVLFVPMIPSSP